MQNPIPGIQSFIFGDGKNAPTYESLQRRRKIADMLAAQATGGTPKNVGEGLNAVGKAIAGAVLNRKLGPQEDDERKRIADILSGGFTGAGTGGYSGDPSTMSGANYGDAIASIESGGNYGATGPQTKSGDRAYGKYQVMGANIPDWSQAALGQPLTPEQFLADPKAQDAVFQKQFGGYVDQYGPEGAASMWFSGDPTPDGDKDQLGTSDTDYVNKFMGALGGGGGGSSYAPPPDMDRVSQLAELMSNPYTSEGQKVVAQAMIERMMAQPESMSPYQMAQLGMDAQQFGLDQKKFERQGEMESQRLELERQRFEREGQAKPTDDIREYEYAKEQGYAGSLQDFMASQRPEGVTVNNTVNPGDNSLKKKLDEKTGERWDKISAAGATAAANNSSFEVLGELIKMAPQGPVQGRLASAFPGVSSAGAAFESIIMPIAPTLRVEGSGATSDIEYEGMLKAMPALRNKPEANALILGMMQAKNDLNIARARIVDQFASGQIDSVGARQQMAELEQKSIMTPEMKALISGVDKRPAAAADWMINSDPSTWSEEQMQEAERIWGIK